MIKVPSESTPTPQSDEPKRPSKAQQIINFKRGVQNALNIGQIDQHEAKELTQLIEDGYGYPAMLRDYINNYRQEGKSVKDFVVDVKAEK